MKKLAVLFGMNVLAGCCTTTPPSQPPDTTNVSLVINKLKKELQRFESTGPAAHPVTKLACTVDGAAIVSIVPTSAQLVLKVVASNTLSGNVGAKIPAGSILTVSPKVTGTYQTIGTQSLTMGLDIAHDDKTAAGAQADVDAALRKIEAYKNAQKELGSSDPMLARRYKDATAVETENLHAAYQALAKTFPRHARVEPATVDTLTVSDQTPKPPQALEGHSLASTLWVLREELLNVDHNQKPCIKPHQLTVDINFEVVKDAKSELGLDIYIVSLGASAESKTDTTQNLSVVFDMAGSSYGVTQ
ncbi:Uncharacterised protein [Burkholderia pseudomallei]|nr:Uncharacterised protein [Burkholderia pseudomallei]CAJ8045759.1 Uncharacterised protein [Burkholderia pseudomallei]